MLWTTALPLNAETNFRSNNEIVIFTTDGNIRCLNEILE